MLSNSTFDVPKAQWEAAKAEAKEVIIERAKVRGMIAHSDLVPRIHAFAMNAHDPRLFHLLGQISSEEDAAGRGMLTVIVVHKVGDMQPGPGFFEVAKSLGRDPRDPLKCWVDELRFGASTTFKWTHFSVAQNKKRRMQQVHPPLFLPDLVAAPVKSVVESGWAFLVAHALCVKNS